VLWRWFNASALPLMGKGRERGERVY